MVPIAGRDQATDYAQAVAARLRQLRKDQRLTQTEVAARTGGVVSKAALANYETGHRSIRIDVFWAITKALGADPGVVMATAERVIGYGTASAEGPVMVDVDAIEASDEPRLAPVRRWFAMRAKAARTRGKRRTTTTRRPRDTARTVSLDPGAITALAELMGTSVPACRQLLAEVGQPATTQPGQDQPNSADAGTASYPFASAG